MTNSDSYIQYGEGVTSFVGPDATTFFRAAVLASAMELYARTGLRANSLYTPTRMRKAAERLTNKKYGRGRDELARAAADVREWARTMKAALPHIDKEA